MSPLVNNTDFVAFDTETGGLNSAECALLSIAAVPSWDAPPFSVHILPAGRIDPKAAEVNGYTPELWAARGAMTPKNALFEFQRWLFEVRGDRRFDMAAHNAGFDLLFILAAQARTGVDLELPGVWHCTKILMQEKREGGAGLLAPQLQA
jgi:DNA polymerase III epsilon subunit-like protein